MKLVARVPRNAAESHRLQPSPERPISVKSIRVPKLQSQPDVLPPISSIAPPTQLDRGLLSSLLSTILRSNLGTLQLWLRLTESFESVDRSLAQRKHVINKPFDHIVKFVATCGLLDLTYSIDLRNVRTCQPNKMSKNTTNLRLIPSISTDLTKLSSIALSTSAKLFILRVLLC